MNLFTTRHNSNNKTPATTHTGGFSSNYAYRELETTPRTTTSGNNLSVMYTRDWRTALRTPPTYRIGNRTVRFNYHFALLLASIVVLFVVFYYIRTGSSSSSDTAWLRSYGGAAVGLTTKSHSISNLGSTAQNGDSTAYNATYPLTQPLVGRGVITYRIGMIADLDTDSKITKTDGTLAWRSYFKKGHLAYVPSKRELKITWDATEPVALESSFALKGRGMELSELVTYNGKLLTFDDRTGLIYEIENDKPIPWLILLDGNGHNVKGFKSEWATVKAQTLYVGSMGKEWTTGSGEFENENPMYVKTISSAGEVHSLDWSYNYKLLRQQAMQISWPGYMIHESGVWSPVHNKWFFLPRRCSTDKYNETRDEHMGCNLLITANEQFNKIDKVTLEPDNTKATHGFSSFKFIPGTDDSIILAIRSEELNGKTSTFITAFDISGKTLLPEERIDTQYKYEGLEFI